MTPDRLTLTHIDPRHVMVRTQAGSPLYAIGGMTEDQIRAALRAHARDHTMPHPTDRAATRAWIDAAMRAAEYKNSSHQQPSWVSMSLAAVLVLAITVPALAVLIAAAQQAAHVWSKIQ